jgi:uncharacterized protein (TIGR03435 family)
MRRIFMAMFVAALTAPLVAQAPAVDRQVFEAASVKPNKSDTPAGPGSNMAGLNLTATNVPLLTIIRQTYQVQGFQIVGGPIWISTERFDIVARAGPPAPPARGAFGAMMQSLLAERFKLSIHRETRTLPVYALVMSRGDGKPGPQLHQPAADCYATVRANIDAKTPPPAGFFCGGMRPGPGELSGRMASMKQLAEFLSPQVGRIVVDKTGITEPFDMDLTWTPGLAAPEARSVTSTAPDPSTSVYTALQEQLGLRLESTTGPVDVLVIDHVERPTEN